MNNENQTEPTITNDTKPAENKSIEQLGDDFFEQFTQTNDIMAKVFTAAKKILDGVENGKKITVGDLIDKVVYESKVKGVLAGGIVRMFLQEQEKIGVGELIHGRNGGFFKGGKAKRQDKRPRCIFCSQVDRNQNKHPIMDLKWIDGIVDAMKKSLPEDQFKTMCSEIADKFKG